MTGTRGRSIAGDNMKNIYTYTFRAVTVICLSYLLTSCIDGEAPWAKKESKPAPAPVEQSYVSIYQVSPGASNADIVVDGVVVNKSSLNFGEKAKYLRIPSGNKTMTLQLSGQDVAQQPINLVKEEQYSVFLVGDTQPTFLVTPVSYNTIPDGYVRIRFLNLSPDAPEANLVEDSETKTLFSGMAFKETPDFIEIPARTSYDVTVRSSVDNSTLVQIPAMKLYPGWTYTILLKGYNNTTSDPSLRLAAEVLSEVER